MSLYGILIGQFFSALADDMLFVVAISALKSGRMATTQEVFILAFVFLAPFVGGFADAFPKGRVLLWSNVIKTFGVVIMINGWILPGYLLVGIGAAFYAPAKYGVLESVSHKALIRANSLLEGVTIFAILLGVFLGGVVTDHWPIATAFFIVLTFYGMAMMGNLSLPIFKPERQDGFWKTTKTFHHSMMASWKDKGVLISLMGTSAFWGMATILRLMMFAWVPLVFHIENHQVPSNLLSAISFGIILGGFFAEKCSNNHKFFHWGILLGASIILLPFIHNLYIAAIDFFLLGIMGGNPYHSSQCHPAKERTHNRWQWKYPCHSESF